MFSCDLLLNYGYNHAAELARSWWLFLRLMFIFEKVYLKIRVGIKVALPDLKRRKLLSIVYLKCTIPLGKVQKYNLSKFVKRTQWLHFKVSWSLFNFQALNSATLSVLADILNNDNIFTETLGNTASISNPKAMSYGFLMCFFFKNNILKNVCPLSWMCTCNSEFSLRGHLGQKN